jgi:hypothetical protein
VTTTSGFARFRRSFEAWHRHDERLDVGDLNLFSRGKRRLRVQPLQQRGCGMEPLGELFEH